jgi:magnesium transporter
MLVLEEEHEQDILRLVGVGREPALSDNVLETTRQQLPGLAVNLCIAIWLLWLLHSLKLS